MWERKPHATTLGILHNIVTLVVLDFWDHFQETTAWRNSTIGDYEAHRIKNKSGTEVTHFKEKKRPIGNCSVDLAADE